MRHSIQIELEQSTNNLEIETKKKISEIETAKFDRIINSIGQDTLLQIAAAGPESQLALLKSLGLNGFVMTDGENPLNLFNFAQNIADPTNN